ncbi:hypothetical protein TKK_0000529 [Trichogramma kaykai]
MGQPIDPTERNFFYNTLSILLRAVEGERTTVDLRNESAINGIVEQADGFMNIVMKDCIFTDPRGDSFKYEIFFVQARNIRYVQIPPHIRIIPAIKKQLDNLHKPRFVQKSRTFKTIRMEKRQAEGVAAVQNILNNRKNPLKTTENK